MSNRARRIVSRLTASAAGHAYGRCRTALQDVNVKNDNGRTYDFYRAGKRNRTDRRVSDLLIDGWSAYYRWLAELKKRLPVNTNARQTD